jgi:hypothetical protein
MMLDAGANVAANAPGDTVTFNTGLEATNFDVSGPGTIALTDDVTVASGGSFSVADDATLETQSSLTIDVSSASLDVLATSTSPAAP